MVTFSTEVTITQATLTPFDAQGTPDTTSKLQVDFNPSSLQLQLSNTLEQKDGKTTEHVTTSSAKLTMDLVFDTSDTFSDVREKTQRIVKMLISRGSNSPSAGDVRPVLFEWGSFSFKGIIETYKETLDFFSASGLPLRASVNLTLSHQDLVFGDENRDAQQRSAAQSLPRGESVSSLAQQSDMNGTQDTGRDIAAANGLESMRFPEGPVTVNGGISLAPPVAFAAGGAGLSAGASAGAAFGAGVGVSAGFGAGIGAGLSAGIGGGITAGIGGAAGGAISAGIGVGFSGGISAGVSGGVSGGAIVAAGEAPVFGGRASAGVPASLGAFNGLRVPLPKPRPQFDVTALQPNRRTGTLALDRAATFDLAGRSLARASVTFDQGR